MKAVFGSPLKNFQPILLGWALGAALLEALFVLALRSLLINTKPLWFAETSLKFSMANSFLSLLLIVGLRTFFQWQFHNKAVFLSVVGMQKLRSKILSRRIKSSEALYRSPLLEKFQNELLRKLPLVQKGYLAYYQSQNAMLQLLLFCGLLPIFPAPYFLGLLFIALPALLISKLRIGYLRKSNESFQKSASQSLNLMEKFSAKLEFLKPNGFLQGESQKLQSFLQSKEKPLLHWERAHAFFPSLMEALYFLSLGLIFGTLFFLSPQSFKNPEIIAFGALMLLMYKPLREWTRNYPLWVQAKQIEGEFYQENNNLPEPSIPVFHEDSSFRISQLTFAYPGKKAIWENLNLNWDARQNCCLSAPNGWGKSSLLKLLCQLENPQQGKINYPSFLKKGKLPSLFYLPQKAQITPAHLSVLKEFSNIFPEGYMELCQILDVKNLLFQYMESPEETWEECWHFQDKLSGGQIQRICLATAFACPQSYLLLDEPTTWLPGNKRVRIMQDLLHFRKQFSPSPNSTGLLCVTHEEDLKEIFPHKILLNSKAQLDH